MAKKCGLFSNENENHILTLCNVCMMTFDQAQGVDDDDYHLRVLKPKTSDTSL